ncbi:hypothetical protein [Halorussus amylolyticus]|uniref:hypothetical protein n=1 Tax=Halorussus amylolyticus TaxID=1126242 RepID=UPI001046528C|nr:hypothetical protein [Halorussus amylolyticus]
MAVFEDSTLVDFDADTALASAREAGGDTIHLCVEYTAEEFHTLYADETTMALYADDRGEMESHFEEVHSYVHIDFTEKDLFSEIFRAAGEVRSFVTFMDNAAFVRILVGTEGLFVSADPDADVTAIIEAAESALD